MNSSLNAIDCIGCISIDCNGIYAINSNIRRCITYNQGKMNLNQIFSIMWIMRMPISTLDSLHYMPAWDLFVWISLFHLKQNWRLASAFIMAKKLRADRLLIVLFLVWCGIKELLYLSNVTPAVHLSLSRLLTLMCVWIYIYMNPWKSYCVLVCL